MYLHEVLSALRRSWRSVVALTLLGGLAAFGFTLTQEEQYTARASVLVAPAPELSPGEIAAISTVVERSVTTYAQLARTPTVLQPVAAELGITSPMALQRAVSTSITSGTTFVSIGVTWTSPEVAADAANLIAEELGDAVAGLAPRQSETGKPSIVVSTYNPALPPSSPSSPDMVTNVLVGVVAGVLVALGLVALRSALDSRVRTAGDLRRVASAPVLGTVTARRRLRRHGARAVLDPRGPAVEDYRRVRTNLRLLHGPRRTRVIVMASCTAYEGTIGVALNLARAAVEGGLRVCLVEADLHGGTHVGLTSGPGLAEVLAGSADLAEVLQHLDGIAVLPPGRAVSDPGDLVGSPRMSSLLEEVGRDHDLVLCATAPLLDTTDAAAVGASADGVVLVVGSLRTRRDELAEATQALHMAGARLLGSVLVESPAAAEPFVARHGGNHGPPQASAPVVHAFHDAGPWTGEHHHEPVFGDWWLMPDASAAEHAPDEPEHGEHVVPGAWHEPGDQGGTGNGGTQSQHQP